MANTYYIKIFSSIFDIEIKKASNNRFLKNNILILLDRYIIAIYLQEKNIIFDYILQLFVYLPALIIYE